MWVISSTGLFILSFITQAGYLMFERLTFQIFDVPDLKVTVYTPLEEADTRRKMELILEQWYRQEGLHTPHTIRQRRTSIPQAELNTVALWFAECCERADDAWVANSTIMASYTHWCQTHNYKPKKAKSIAQFLAAQGRLEVGVRKWIYVNQEERIKTRGVRGLRIK
jgi:hypothetical protein